MSAQNQLSTAASVMPAEQKSPTGAITLDPSNLADAAKFADLMSRSKQGVPKPFRGEPGLCFAVVCQAMAWKMNPFQVASQAYVVNDQVAYMAQIIKAAVDSHAPLEEPLEIEFGGKGTDRFARVIGRIVTRSGKTVERIYESPPIRQIPVKNSPLWKNDPDQQLGYYAVRSWARRHAPGVLAGVYEAEEIKHGSTVNAAPTETLEERLKKAEPVSIKFTNTTEDPDPVSDTDEPGSEVEAEAEAADPEPASAEVSQVIAQGVLAIAEAKDIDAANAAFDALEDTPEWQDATEEEKEPARAALASKFEMEA